MNCAKKNENIAVFMGSGVSSFVNPKYPVWAGVSERLKQELTDCKEENNLDIAQAYLNKFGKKKLTKTVNSLFPDFSPNIEFYHELLECRPQYLITTNWDNMLQVAIESRLYMYDTIADDKELMNSKLFNKYIKMHGDFQYGFVLTRNSYKSYSKNYPLIENFVKGILCTNTVLFIGYSLSDENFQQILNWINISAPAAPRFYCAFDSKYYNEETALKFNNKEIVTFTTPNFTLLFKSLNDSNIELQNKDPIQAFAEIIKPLSKDKSILLSSLQSFITNYTFAYKNEYQLYLNLLTNELTYDYNESRRDFFKNLSEALGSLNGDVNTIFSDNLQVIRDILNKAGVSGIIYSRNNKILNCIEYNNKSVDYTNLDYEIHDEDSKEYKVRKLYEFNNLQKTQIINALELNSEILKSDIKEKKYRKLFISYFNQNKIIRTLNISVPISDAIDCIDIKKKYLALPSVLQAETYDIYNFVSGETLRDKLITLTDVVKSIKNTIKNSSLAFDNDRYRWSIEHKNLNDFVLLNHILIENDYLFLKVQQLYVEIAILRKTIQNNTILNRNELFSCIHYFNHSANNYTLDKLFSDNEAELKFREDDEIWLVNTVLPNCIKNYKLSSPCCTKPYLSNLLIIFSHGVLSNESITKIFESMGEIIVNCICNGYILSKINNFICFQYHNHIDLFTNFKFLPLFISAVSKNIENRSGPEEQLEFLDSRFHCYDTFYKMAKANGEIFTNVKYLEKIINSYEHAVFDAKTKFYINILMPFYVVGNKDVKNYLKNILLDFVDNILGQPVPSQYGKFEIIHLHQIEYYEHWYKLKLIEIELKKAEPEYIQILESWLKNIYDQVGTTSLDFMIIKEIFLLNTKYPQFETATEICKKNREKHISNRILQI